jgi:hypothetical protein
MATRLSSKKPMGVNKTTDASAGTPEIPSSCEDNQQIEIIYRWDTFTKELLSFIPDNETVKRLLVWIFFFLMLMMAFCIMNLISINLGIKHGFVKFEVNHNYQVLKH